MQGRERKPMLRLRFSSTTQTLIARTTHTTMAMGIQLLLPTHAQLRIVVVHRRNQP